MKHYFDFHFIMRKVIVNFLDSLWTLGGGVVVVVGYILMLCSMCTYAGGLVSGTYLRKINIIRDIIFIQHFYKPYFDKRYAERFV